MTRNLTANLGLRYEFEQGLQERDNRLTVGFDRSAAFPVQIPGALRPDGTPLELKGGLMYARRRRQSHAPERSIQEEVRATHRLRVLAEPADGRSRRVRAVLRAEPVRLPGREPAGHARVHGGHDVFRQQRRRPHAVRRVLVDQPVPERDRAAAVGSALGLRTGVGGTVHFVDQFREVGLRASVFRRCPARAAKRHVVVRGLPRKPVREAVGRRHQLEHRQHQPARATDTCRSGRPLSNRCRTRSSETRPSARSVARRRLPAVSSCVPILNLAMSSRTR